MKKSYLFGMFALAAMTMVGCSNDEVVNDYSQDNAIEFGTYVGRGVASRASVITTKELGEQGFGVFAYYTGSSDFGVNETAPNFMYNEEVTASPNDWVDDKTTPGYYKKWTYSPLKYWPNTQGHKVSFFAYAPYKATVTGDITKVPSVEFEIPQTVKDQEDILYATPMLDQEKKKIDEPVVFTFNHALSRIGFQVQTTVDVVNSDEDGDEDDDNTNGTLDGATTVIIKDVKLSGAFYNKGKLGYEATLNVGPNGSIEVGDMRVSMDDNGTTAASQTYQLSAGTTVENSNFAAPEQVICYAEGKYTTKYVGWGQKVTTQEATLNKTDDSYIMIIPKKFEGEDKITVEVEYDVVTVDSNLPDGVVTIPNTVKTSFTDIEFEAGKAYTFSLHLGLTSVQLSASVAEWTPADGIDYSVNLPINVK